MAGRLWVSRVSLSTPAVVTLLLERGADINARNNNGWTPLHHAVRHNTSAMVTLLLERGADINARDALGTTVLHHIARQSDPATVAPAAAFLLDAGADINAQDEQGKTPLHTAAGRPMLSAGRTPDYDYSALVTLLLDRGRGYQCAGYVGLDAFACCNDTDIQH